MGNSVGKSPLGLPRLNRCHRFVFQLCAVCTPQHSVHTSALSTPIRVLCTHKSSVHISALSTPIRVLCTNLNCPVLCKHLLELSTHISHVQTEQFSCIHQLKIQVQVTHLRLRNICRTNSHCPKTMPRWLNTLRLIFPLAVDLLNVII